MLERMRKILSRNRRFVITVYLVLDIIIFFGGTILCFLSNAGLYSFTNTNWYSILIYAGAVTIISLILFAICGVYKIVISNFGIIDSLKIGVYVFGIQVLCFAASYAIPTTLLPDVTISSWILTTLSIMFLAIGMRVIARLTRLYIIHTAQEKNIRTLVIGAGAAAKIAIDESNNNKDSKNKIVVLVDDDPNKIGGTFSNIPVKGPISTIATIIDYYKIEEVIIAIASLDETRYKEILEYLEPCSVRIKKMPLMSEMNGPNDVKIVNVDLDDLLCRKPIKLDNSSLVDLLDNKTVLITGAGGSIGSELCRQIFDVKPSKMILFDIYENGVYAIQQELLTKIRETNNHDTEIITLIGSTYNEVRMEQVFKKYKPDYVYHAAAYKHVPLMEDSPAEAIRTNVIGTYNVAKLADKYCVKKMVLVSTDKAVRPTNVMGATKRFAETIIQYFSEQSKHTYYAAVRFGNVLGSNGSVVPLFEKQIAAGGPVTLTHKDIIRYFMTIPEAVSLILQCSIFATGGEIFILDMGKPVKISTLAEKLIRQSGFIPYKDIQIIETGLRPGEKLYEELLLDVENQIKTSNKKIFIEQKEDIRPIENQIIEITKVFDMDENNDIKNMLASIIATYSKDN